MLVKEFLEAIKTSYSKYFPESKCSAGIREILSIKDIGIYCYLSNDLSECSSNIRENDMFSVYFSVDGDFKDLEDDITDKDLVLGSYRRSYTIKPTDRYCVYGGRVLKFRKTVGKHNKILKALDKFFKQLKDSLIEDYNNNNIHEDYIKLFKKKLNITVNEICPYCEHEVELKTVFEKQICPNCKQLIKPCSMCNMDQVTCSKCKL